MWRFLKELKLELPYDSATAVLGISPKDTNVVIRRGACTPTFIAATSTRAKLWKEPRCPPTDEWIKQMWGMDREIGSYSYRSVSISIYLYLAIHLYLATSICHLSIYLSIYLSVICHLSSVMKYYSAIQKKKILPFAMTWMELEGIMVSAITQRKKIII